MGRKTFSVSELTELVNNTLSVSWVKPEYREGMIATLERVLHDTGNYRGYRYLTSNEVPAGHQPGIRYDDANDKHSFDDCDSTRRQYR